MFRSSTTRWFWLAAVFLTQSALAFFDPPYITPQRPVAGEQVAVNVRGGICDAIVSEPGYPQVTQKDDSIRVLLLAFRYENSELCFLPIGTATVPFGSYPAGNYTVTVDVFYYDSHGEPRVDTLGVVPMAVGGAVPDTVSVPAVGLPALLVLIIGFVFLVRRRVPVMAVLAACLGGSVSLDARAIDGVPETIELLVSSAPGAPDPQRIIEFAARPEGAPPLSSLALVRLDDAQYLMRERAEGDFLARLRENPQSPRAKLESYLILALADGEDAERALALLRADPLVEAAFMPRVSDVSSVELIGFEVSSGPVSRGQYGLDLLDVKRAWSVATGNALIIAVDTGTHPQHPALRPFSGATYAGGSFVPDVSHDFGLTGLELAPEI